MEEDIEFLEDQIVPDQDDLFLPPAEVTWNVSYIILLWNIFHFFFIRIHVFIIVWFKYMLDLYEPAVILLCECLDL